MLVVKVRNSTKKQGSERKKWVNCFKDVTAVIFVSALSDYDQKCYEDDETNRLQESLNLFKEICNGEWFSKTAIMLVLNKIDVFKNKIKRSPLTKMFSDYEGGDNPDAAIKHIENHFRSLNKFDQDRIYPHLTCATDFDSVKQVFNNMNAKIIELNLGTTI
jgi:guanine nucleotide-binding protein G(i) subunit alpha